VVVVEVVVVAAMVLEWCCSEMTMVYQWFPEEWVEYYY
jgi:hypothetical protein